jgi:CelD/BcsL family acetyltransferase involved in cellulose biosynthesis
MRRRGTADVAEIVDRGLVARAPVSEAVAARTPVPLAAISTDAWRGLSARAIEPNGYYLPDWELAVNASAPGRTGASALCAWSDTPAALGLIGLLPVISLWRACKIPLPALVSAHPYGTLCTPLIDRDRLEDATASLLEAARRAGAHALLLREVSLDGPVMKAVGDNLLRDGLRPHLLQSHQRACLDATREAEELLREALGAKKLKELRRLHHRLAEHGAVTFDVARSPREVAAALETFLALEASGWKGRRGTALDQNEGDAIFIRRATAALAKTGQCEIVSLRAGVTAVAAGIVLRHQERAFFFKIGVDERFAKFSPGVQLTLELTGHLCDDPVIASADSTASPDHPMINPIWRGRFAIGDVLIPLRQRDPLVPLIHAALGARLAALDLARRGVRTLRLLRTS